MRMKEAIDFSFKSLHLCHVLIGEEDEFLLPVEGNTLVMGEDGAITVFTK